MACGKQGCPKLEHGLSAGCDAQPGIDLLAAKMNVRFWHLADITAVLIHVRFRGQSGHWLEMPRCLLLTQSGHERLR
jgi:hypothetical protein